MKENKIRDYRKKLGLTQKQLADKVGTSQQQIQRIEAGVQTARFDIAAQIGAELGVPMEKIFPSIKKKLKPSQNLEMTSYHDVLKDRQLRETLEEAGIDIDPNQNYFEVRLRGGATKNYAISGPEKKRLFRLAQTNPQSKEFAVFDSAGKTVLLNLRHIMFCKFQVESWDCDEYDGEEKESSGVEIFLSDSPDPVTFTVDPDSVDLFDDQVDDWNAQFQQICFTADNLPIGVADDEVAFYFKDYSRETVFVRHKDIALMEIPFIVASPLGLEQNEEAELQS